MIALSKKSGGPPTNVLRDPLKGIYENMQQPPTGCVYLEFFIKPDANVNTIKLHCIVHTLRFTSAKAFTGVLATDRFIPATKMNNTDIPIVCTMYTAVAFGRKQLWSGLNVPADALDQLRHTDTDYKMRHALCSDYMSAYSDMTDTNKYYYKKFDNFTRYMFGAVFIKNTGSAATNRIGLLFDSTVDYTNPALMQQFAKTLEGGEEAEPRSPFAAKYPRKKS